MYHHDNSSGYSACVRKASTLVPSQRSGISGSFLSPSDTPSPPRSRVDGGSEFDGMDSASREHEVQRYYEELQAEPGLPSVVPLGSPVGEQHGGLTRRPHGRGRRTSSASKETSCSSAGRSTVSDYSQEDESATTSRPHSLYSNCESFASSTGDLRRRMSVASTANGDALSTAPTSVYGSRSPSPSPSEASRFSFEPISKRQDLPLHRKPVPAPSRFQHPGSYDHTSSKLKKGGKQGVLRSAQRIKDIFGSSKRAPTEGKPSQGYAERANLPRDKSPKKPLFRSRFKAGF
jgi:hypothetical protein